MISAGVLKYRTLPVLESDVIQARVLLPQGTLLNRTEEVVNHLVTELKALDEAFSRRPESGQRLLKNISPTPINLRVRYDGKTKIAYRLFSTPDFGEERRTERTGVWPDHRQQRLSTLDPALYER